MNRPLATLLSATALAAVLLTLGSISARASNTPVTIEHCFVTQPKPLSKLAGGTQITYVLNGTKAAKSITFAVAYRNAENNFLRKVTDVGTFQPGVTVDHHFDLYNDVTYAGKQTHSCYPTVVKYKDGSVWKA